MTFSSISGKILALQKTPALLNCCLFPILMNYF
jgi:hypothetical protein